MSTPFWINKPSILINQEYMLQFWPTEKMTSNEKLNSISRLVIILTIIGTLLVQSFRMIITGIITLFAIVFLYYLKKNKENKKESFTSLESIRKSFVTPTPKNPVMNVALTDYTEQPQRNSAAPAFNPLVEEKINETTQSFIVSQFDNCNPTEKESIHARLFQDLEIILFLINP